MSGVCLAMAWHPRGEEGRFARFYPLVDEIYGSIVVSVPPEADVEALALIRPLPGLHLLEGRAWRSGRHLVVEAALTEGAEYVHYVDGDRLVRWVETRPDELRETVERIQTVDCLVIGRTEAAFATHPLAQQEPERLSNEVFARLLGRPFDLSSGSKGFSRRAAEFLLRNSPPERPMGTDSEWVVLLDRGGFTVESLLVDGLDWETADRYLAHAADAETQRRVADEYDAAPEHWLFRVKLAQEIIEAGFDALKRPLDKTPLKEDA